MKGKLALKAANSAVDAALKAAKASCDLQTRTEQPHRLALGLTTAIKHEHMLFLQSKRAPEGGRMGLPSTQSPTGRSARHGRRYHRCHHMEAFEETTTSFSSKLAKEHFPNEYLACMTQQPNSVRVNVHEGRKYLP